MPKVQRDDELTLRHASILLANIPTYPNNLLTEAQFVPESLLADLSLYAMMLDGPVLLVRNPGHGN